MTSLVELYAFYCRRAKCHPNSGFATALHQGALEEFDFSVNYIGPKGLDPVLEVVRNNSQLRALNLNSNWLEQGSVAKVVETAVHHPNIRCLSLSDNPIHSSSYRALMYLLQQNQNIVELDLERTDLAPGEKTKLKNALLRNRQSPHDALLNRKHRISSYSTEEELHEDPRIATYNGTWGAGTSGGCLHYNTWRENQQLSLWPSRSGSVSITLKQTAPEDPQHTVGVVVIKRNDTNSHQSLLTYQPTDLLAESNFVEGKAHLTVALDQRVQGVDDPYTVIPMTFRPGRTGSYQVSVKEVRPDEQPGDADTNSTTFVFEPIKPERDWRRLEPLTCEWSPLTAGGCRDYPSWRSNCQYQLTASVATKCFVVLSKAVDRDQNDEREIGFYVLKGPREAGRTEMMIQGGNLIASTMFSRTTSVSLMIDVPPGAEGVVLLPTTIRPNQCGEFFLHLYSEAEVAVTPLPQSGYWKEHAVTGLWDISTNGGCRQLNSASWVYNPSYELEVAEQTDVLAILEKVPSGMPGDARAAHIAGRALSSEGCGSLKSGGGATTNPRRSYAARPAGERTKSHHGSRHGSTAHGSRHGSRAGSTLKPGTFKTPQPPPSVAASAARTAAESEDPEAPPPKVFSEDEAHEGAIALLLIDNNASGTTVSQCLRQQNTTSECALWCPRLPASASGYILIPSFIEAGLEGKYCLRVYTSRSTVMDQGMTMKARIKLRDRLKWKAENEASNRERNLDFPDTQFAGDPAMTEAMKERDGIVNNYLTRGVQHLDKGFPPSSTSIYLDPNADPCPVLSAWKRPQDCCLDASLFKGGKHSGCLRAGLMKNLWFLGAAAMVATQPKLLQHVFLAVYPEYGFYQLRFFVYGEWVPVTVDDLVAVDAENAFLFAASPVANELWPAVLEKAYAKLHGTYEALEIDGDVADGLTDLTGGVSEKLLLPASTDKPLAPAPDSPYEVAITSIHTKLCSALRDNYPVGFILSKAEANPLHVAEKKALGIHPDHVYPVLQIREVRGVKLVCLRDCWGHGGWAGKFSLDSAAWTDDLREAVAFDPEAGDGSFWMAWDEVTYYFTSVYICRLHGANTVQPDHWTSASVQGSWIKGKTDGGEASSGDDWVRNVQYALDFADYGATAASNDTEGAGRAAAPDSFPVWIQVEQRDARLDILKTVSHDHKRLQYANALGMHLFSSDSNSRKLVALTSREGVHTSRFQQRRVVSAEWKVMPGARSYTVVPCTQAQGMVGDFLLTVAAPRPVAIREIESNFNISIDGTWKGATRGGAPKLFGTWRENPFYLLTCAETTTLTLILRQSNLLNSTTARIGLLVYDAKGPRRFLHVEESRVVAIAEHSNTDKVAVKVHVAGVRERGGLPYIIVPSTYYPRQDSDFTIEVIGNKKSTLKKVDPFIDYSCYTVHGCWSEVAGTVGGCLEFPTWRGSPQYLLQFGDRTGGEKKFLMVLTKILPNTVTTDTLEVCITVFRATEVEGGWRKRVAQPTEEDIVARTNYTERGATNYVELEAALPYSKYGYLVMVSTRYPCAEGDFKLSLYTDTDARLLEPPADKFWHTTRFDGTWKPGVNAGGSREAYRTWGCNPNYRLVVREHSDVVLVLTQCSLLPGQGGKRGSDARAETAAAAAKKKQRWQQNLIDKSNNASIGIDLCKDDDGVTHIQRIQYDYATVVTMTLPNLAPGSYVVVPHTFEAEIESEYNLVVYSDSACACEKIEKKRRYY